MGSIWMAPMIVGAALLTQGGSAPSASAPSGAPPKVVSPKTPAPASYAGNAFERRLAAIDARMADVTDLRADFEQRKKTALLKKPLISGGTLICRGETVLWKTTRPRTSSMLVSDAKVTVHYPEDKLAEVYSMGSRFRDAAGGPLPRLSKLKERFEIVEIDAAAMGLKPEELKGKVALKLTPRTEELRKHVTSVRVILDEGVPCADRVVIADPEGDETEVRFTNVRINSGVKDAELELNLPEGTRISTPVGGESNPAAQQGAKGDGKGEGATRPTPETRK